MTVEYIDVFEDAELTRALDQLEDAIENPEVDPAIQRRMIALHRQQAPAIWTAVDEVCRTWKAKKA